MSEKLPQTMNAIAIGDDGTSESLHMAEHGYRNRKRTRFWYGLARPGSIAAIACSASGFIHCRPARPILWGWNLPALWWLLARTLKNGSRATASQHWLPVALCRICPRPSHHALAIPDAMSFTDAAALPETIFTVFANVFEGGHCKKVKPCLCMALKRHWHHSHSNGQTFRRQSHHHGGLRR